MEPTIQDLQESPKRRENRIFPEFRRKSVMLARLEYIFLIIFTLADYVFISIRGLITQSIDPISAVVEIFMGLGIVSILIILYLAAHTRLGYFLNLVALAYYIFLPGGDIFSSWEDIFDNFALSYILMGLPLLFFALVGVLMLLNLLFETVELGMNGRSIIFGPWFSLFLSKSRRIEPPIPKTEQIHRVKVGILTILVLVGAFLPGLLPAVVPSIYPIPVQIYPQDYQTRWNFWVTPELDGISPDPLVVENGWGEYYNASERFELNEHKCNLDLTFNRFTYADVAQLVQWETELPDITYRITIYPSDLRQLPAMVVEATTILMELEANGTIDQWRGFCFDIEGGGYQYRPELESFGEAVGIWKSVFAYIDRKSIERGRQIEMECVSGVSGTIDYQFDGDYDMQKEDRMPFCVPDNFTLYAPMIYRCWYKGVKPFGSPEEPDHLWTTSYAVYSSLDLLSKGVAGRNNGERLGIYLGLTNCSCYGRDLPQPEPYTWPDGPNSGLYNLMRDVLIAKHFGIKEITFFLLWSIRENGYMMGGVFDSYGLNFLDVVNATVNGPSAPESFTIFYNYKISETGDVLRKDWIWDFSQAIGVLELLAMWLLALQLWRKYLLSKRE